MRDVMTFNFPVQPILGFPYKRKESPWLGVIAWTLHVLKFEVDTMAIFQLLPDCEELRRATIERKLADIADALEDAAIDGKMVCTLPE